VTLAMDMRIAAEDAKIGFVFARRGVVLEACSSWFLPRIVGMAKATELAYTGRIFRAAEEKNSGLFNHVVAHDQVLAKAGDQRPGKLQERSQTRPPGCLWPSARRFCGTVSGKGTLSPFTWWIPAVSTGQESRRMLRKAFRVSWKKGRPDLP